MPGLLGIICRNDEGAHIDLAAEKMIHFPWLAARKFRLSETIALGVVFRMDRKRDYDWHYNSRRGAAALISGCVSLADPDPRVLSARAVLEEYLQKGHECWGQFEAGFLAAIVDLEKGRLFLSNDRIGTLPLYYARRAGAFAFASEAKGVFVQPGFEARLSSEGILNFLSSGYCYGSRTLFEGVEILEPGSVLSVRLDSLEVEKRHFWGIVYEPAERLRSRRYAEDALRDAILQGHRAVLAREPRRLSVLLSGGWDSRCMLAALEEIGRPADLAQSWGIDDSIEHSDAYLARELAARFGVPFSFYRHDTDTFIQNAHDWCYLTELANDNFGWFSEGAGALIDFYDRRTDLLLVGDEFWGAHGVAANEREARAESFPPTLPNHVATILRTPLARCAAESYEAAVASVTGRCENRDYSDRKDFYYFYIRAPRFLFSLGYYREWATPMARPFLANCVIEIVRRLPVRLRLWKNLYISTLRRHFPQALAVPVASVNSLPDWTRDLRCKEPLRSCMQKYLDFGRISRGKLGELIDRAQFERMRGEFFAQHVNPIRRAPSKKTALKKKILRSRQPWLQHLLRMNSRRSFASDHAADPMNLLRRIALLSMLQEQLGRLSRPDPIRSAAQQNAEALHGGTPAERSA
ncbi:MAG: hypothetical protein AB1640_18350 [bacterium]